MTLTDEEKRIIIQFGQLIDDQILPTINELIDQIEDLRRDVHILKFDFSRLRKEIPYLKYP